MAKPQNSGDGGKRVTNNTIITTVIIYKPFPQSIRAFENNILMHVWLSELPRYQLTRIINNLLHFDIDFFKDYLFYIKQQRD
jgi:hypothetical protein